MALKQELCKMWRKARKGPPGSSLKAQGHASIEVKIKRTHKRRTLKLGAQSIHDLRILFPSGKIDECLDLREIGTLDDVFEKVNKRIK